jgi:hypothetical protein
MTVHRQPGNVALNADVPPDKACTLGARSIAVAWRVVAYAASASERYRSP